MSSRYNECENVVIRLGLGVLETGEINRKGMKKFSLATDNLLISTTFFMNHEQNSGQPKD